MFIFSVKTSRFKIFMWSFCILLVLIIGFIAIKNNNSDYYAVTPSGKYCIRVKTNEERVKFLEQFGWELSPEPVEITQVTVPSAFNQTYEKYNEMQKTQGFDLTRHRERTCKRYTYQIMNHKAASSGVRANLLMIGDKIIAGDICSMELNGFMHGFIERDKIKKP